jgi:hypothetical protein
VFASGSDDVNYCQKYPPGTVCSPALASSGGEKRLFLTADRSFERLRRSLGKTVVRLSAARLTEHSDHRVADLFRVCVEVQQDPRRDPFGLAYEPEQDVLRADVVVA